MKKKGQVKKSGIKKKGKKPEIEWQIWFVRKDNFGQFLIHRKFKKLNWNLLMEV